MENEAKNLPTAAAAAPPPLSPSSGPKRGAFFPVAGSWFTASVVGGIMILLALLGVALTSMRSDMAPNYWIALVPVYGILCIATVWARSRQDGTSGQTHILRQILHWAAIGGALALDFVIRGTGEETAPAAGLNAMVLLALGCFLAGVHLEWLFGVVGLVLAMAMIMAAKFQQYLWIVFLLGGLAVVGMFAFRWLAGKWHSNKAARVSP